MVTLAIAVAGLLLLLLLVGITGATLSYVVSIDNNGHHDGGDGNDHRERRECCFTPGCVERGGDDTADCEVDIVIVGCGSAGSVMANLLSRVTGPNARKFSVLCLERGKYYDDDPAIKYILQGSTFWMFTPALHAKYSFNQLDDPDPNLGALVSTYNRARWWEAPAITTTRSSSIRVAI